MSQLRPVNVPSLIQGISQQSDQAVGQASAKDQENCINDLLYGSMARNGSRVLGCWAGEKDDPFFHRIRRSSEEDYLVMIEGTSLDIINLVDGTKSTVTGDISAYLGAVPARKKYAAATVEDTTFVANLSVSPQMETTTSPARSNHAIAHFKSANYSTEYTLHIKIGSTTYSVSYTTPDNSTSANAEYIATNSLAESFRAAIVSTLIPALTTAGHTGFGVSRRGSVLRIYGDDNEFSLWTEDGLGGQQFIAFRDRINDVSDLPSTCWDGFLVAVGAEKVAATHDYYVQYQGEAQTGEWVEVVAPSTETTIDAATMPHVLRNTGPNAFTVEEGTWGTRLSGDGDRTAQDPYFIGDNIVDLQFFDSRMAIVGQGWFSLSKSGNAYLYFPDTAQTTLDDDAVQYRITNGKVTLVRAAVVVGDSLQFWSDGLQSRLSSGQENISEDTVESLPTTFYEFDGEAAPETFGKSSLMFGTSRGRWNSFTEVIYNGEVPAGEIDVDGHCPRLVEGTMRQLQVGASARYMAVLTSEKPNLAYIYQWFNNGSERVQSAWSKWTFPSATRVLWMGMQGSKVYLMVSWGSKYTLEVLDTEYEGDEDSGLPLRADHRVNEESITAAGDGYVDVTLPYPMPEGARDNFVSYFRVNDDATGEQRGQLLEIEWQSSTVIRVFTDVTSPRLWVGAKIISYRDLPKVYITDQNGASVLLDGLTIASLKVSHTNSTTYRVQVFVTGTVEPEEATFSARLIGDPEVVNNRVPVEQSGEFDTRIGFGADECSIRLLNDTIYPSSWDSLRYMVNPTSRPS